VIVVDSSVWIANLRDLNTASVRRLRELDHATEPVLVGDLILLEVLQGARDEQHADRMGGGCGSSPSSPCSTPTWRFVPPVTCARHRDAASLRARRWTSSSVRSVSSVATSFCTRIGISCRWRGILVCAFCDAGSGGPRSRGRCRQGWADAPGCPLFSGKWAEQALGDVVAPEIGGAEVAEGDLGGFVPGLRMRSARPAP
jgi:hypothetical protein